MVEVVDALESRGLTKRERNPADRRAYALELTDEGSRVLAARMSCSSRCPATTASSSTACCCGSCASSADDRARSSDVIRVRDVVGSLI